MKLHRLPGSSAMFATSVVAALIALGCAVPAVAEGTGPTPEPNSSASATAPLPDPKDSGFANRDGDTDVSRERQLEARYGHDRDIATPPLIVRQSAGSSKFVTKPIHIEHLTPSTGARELEKPLRAASSHPIKLAAGQTVVAGLQPTDFESPASQFMNFAYVFMGVLVLILVTLAIGLTSRKDRLDV